LFFVGWSSKSTKGPTKREIEIADIVNNSIKGESFVTTLVPMITDAIQHNLELTIRQTIIVYVVGHFDGHKWSH
jgi:hypothetical protein